MKPAEDYILNQEEPFKSILLQLQSIVEAVLPEPELLYKWRIPFYYNNDLPVCYLNQSKNYVDLAFWHGDKLTKYRKHFVTENRKSVTSLRYKLVEDINDEVIQYILEEQLRINTNPFKLTRVGKAKN
ncbi:uncharacterized protein DUF1801 [Winogradskyella wandonensis]|uniref:Uncharacterized protein DUF1801 n=1 Tax=Winogradskyella wandonensis TaxID=1442586 RepID=A0A4R1KP70_9FLAO|nr:DUF1801 domain-containing protein [Winogradskyella wandonensis]TCK66845.1 uncharacterized protein DUF1801 [Winogradskyella wandonensis]